MLGLPGGSFGVAWPSVRAEFGLPLSALGLVVIATGAGFVLSSAASGWVATRLPTGRLVALAAGLLALGIGAFAAAPAFTVCLVGAVFAGAGGGLLDAGLTAHVALHRGLRSMNALHAAWGVGSTLGTLLVTAAVTGAGWRLAYAVMGICYVVLVGVFLVIPAEGDGDARAPEASRSPRIGVALGLALALFFVYTGLESVAGAWSFSYLVVHLPAAAAGLLVSGYWAAFTGGRAALAAAGGRFGALALLNASVALSLLGAVLMLFGFVPALPLVGLGLAAVYPALMNLTPARLGRSVAAHAVGYQTASGNLGGTLLPAGAGLALQAGGVGLLPGLLVATTLVMLALHVLAGRRGTS